MNSHCANMMFSGHVASIMLATLSTIHIINVSGGQWPTIYRNLALGMSASVPVLVGIAMVASKHHYSADIVVAYAIGALSYIAYQN